MGKFRFGGHFEGSPRSMSRRKLVWPNQKPGYDGRNWDQPLLEQQPGADDEADGLFREYGGPKVPRRSAKVARRESHVPWPKGSNGERRMPAREMKRVLWAAGWSKVTVGGKQAWRRKPAADEPHYTITEAYERATKEICG